MSHHLVTTILFSTFLLSACATNRNPTLESSDIIYATDTHILFEDRPDVFKPETEEDAQKINRPIVISNPPPIVQAEAGSYVVSIAYIVERDGTVQDAIIFESSGSSEVDKGILRSIKSRLYKPATFEGSTIAIVVRQRIHYVH